MNIPRTLFAHLPTPIEALPHLTTLLGGPQLLIKRDDLTGLAFGGNKARKLEFVLAEAQANGAKTLVTVGDIQSNHCRQTAAIAAKFGFKCILVLSGTEPDLANGNLLLDHLLGAEIVWTVREERANTLKTVFQQAWENGERPYLIPLGASNPVGTFGYVEAIREIVGQKIDVNWIVVASSSGGTQAGMVLGAHLYNWSGKILGICIDHHALELQTTVTHLANEASERIGKDISISSQEILVNDRYLGGGYAVAGEVELEAIRMFAKTEGILLDPVYTGRAAAGMIDLIKNGFFTQEDKVLFWHTGGSPTLFAEPYSAQLNK
ncbi:MAG: D-cysteine desulfhydrase [Chloroflexi bacterium]|nr:MAG: D-cysteine desulfhydrase [Chloroflexota bacterium]MBA4376157.1 D-cysteine desulfhydrase family protein [Anaerolinea sp.]